MQRPLTMPKLGMTMTEGTVVRWLYEEGARIEKGEPLVEVMTDKVSLEVEAPFTGRLLKIVAQEGETLPVGADLALLEDEGKVRAGGAVATAGAGAAALPVPTMASTTTTSTAREPALDAAATAAPAELPERIASTPAAKREAAARALDLHELVAAGITPPITRADVLAFVSSRQPAQVRATPLARKMAHEHQIDLGLLAERRGGEKVTRADVETLLASRRAQNGAASSTPQTQTQAGGSPAVSADGVAAAPMPASPLSVHDEETEVIPLSPARRLIGQRMLASVTSMPHIYLDLEIDMSEAERCRQLLARSLQQAGETPPSLTALVIRAVAAALRAHPEVNATLDSTGGPGREVIRRWHGVHIGVAVDTGQALLTPVIRDAARQSLPELGRTLRRLVAAARAGKLTPDELSGATFTVSNLGMYGIDTFHAIIPPGQCAILATGRVSRRGVVVGEGNEERLEIRPIMKVSLSADHRVLDGAAGSRFLQHFKSLLENPYLLV